MPSLKVDYRKLEPDSAKAMNVMADYLKSTKLEQSIRDLVYIRASQINGCAYCLDMHMQEARANGETEQKLNCISVWRDAPFFSPREMTALEFTEAMTSLSQGRVSEDLQKRTLETFGEHEYIALIMAVNVINCWNRLMIGCGGKAGMYVDRSLRDTLPGYFYD